MAQIGNKNNSYLEGEWGKHAHQGGKKVSAKRRRAKDSNEIKEELNIDRDGQGKRRGRKK